MIERMKLLPKATLLKEKELGSSGCRLYAQGLYAVEQEDATPTCSNASHRTSETSVACNLYHSNLRTLTHDRLPSS